jgi:hypothetical protein
MITYEFLPPEDSCHNYFVQADTLEEAIEKFKAWQKKEFTNLEDHWDDEEIKDPENWQTDSSIHFIG